MALRSLTNSPVRLSQVHRKTQLSETSEFSVSSISSGAFPVLSLDDGIYNAQRVVTDQKESILDAPRLRPVYQSNHDRVSGIDPPLRKQALSEGNTTITEHPLMQRSLTEVQSGGHCRGWSLNDLDCATHVHSSFQNAIFRRSPSSNDALEAAANVTVYPHLPPRPPPCRKSTPDGIPSFGTREAQELRLVPPSRLYRLTKLIQRRFQPLEPAENVTHDAINAQNVEQPRYSAPERPRFERPVEVLRRVSGMVRPVYITDGARKFHRSTLPRGVKIVSAPGDLTVAEDGSQVRGRFGNRASGHGIGQRTMDLHPLVRRPETSMIEEEVRAIDKACNRESLRERAHLGSNPIEYRSISRPENENLQIPARRHTETMEVLTVTQAMQNERRAVRALQEQRQQNIELRAVLKGRQSPSIAPSITFHPHHTNQLSLSRNSSSTIYHSARARTNTSNMRSSGSETIRPPRMIEPASYDVEHPRSAATLDNIMMRSTMEETLEGQEHDQAVQEARQGQNRKSETEVCWKWTCGAFCCCWFPGTSDEHGQRVVR